MDFLKVPPRKRKPSNDSGIGSSSERSRHSSYNSVSSKTVSFDFLDSIVKSLEEIQQEYSSPSSPIKSISIPRIELETDEEEPPAFCFPTHNFAPLQVSIPVDACASTQLRKIVGRASGLMSSQQGLLAILEKNHRCPPLEKRTTISKKNKRCLENFCAFCKNNTDTNYKLVNPGWKDHRLYDESGQVICPILFKYVCPVCNQTGPQAHTLRYCPLRRQRELAQQQKYFGY